MSDDNFGLEEESYRAGVETAPATVGSVRIDKREYAVGLYWVAVDIPASAAKEARGMAKSQNADYFCVRTGTTTQYGLGFKSAGHKANMPSLAAHLANVKSGSWLGLFEVPGGYYLIAVRDDGVIAETDRFIADRDMALDEFDSLQSQSDWGATYAPNSLDVPGSKEETLSGLLTGKPPARLTEVGRTGAMIRLAAVAVLVGGGLIGGMTYLDSVEQERIRLEAEEQMRLAQEMLKGKEPEIQVPPMPWEGKKLAVPMLNACVDAAKKFPTDIPGWIVREVFCEGESIAVAIDRQGQLGGGGGSVTWIEPYVAREGFKPGIDFPKEGSGNRIRVQWGLEGLPSIPVAIQTLGLREVRRGMIQVMEERMTRIDLSEADANQFWQGLSFRFVTQEEPTAFGDLLGAIPGVIITRIQFSVESGAWSLEGKVYEQLPLPKNAKVSRP